MKLAIRLACACVLVALFSGWSLASDDVVLGGSFVWNSDDGDHKGDLKAVFSPKGDGKDDWSVSFYFQWEESPHIWSGTAKGSLSEGALEGEVESDGERKSTFRFSGSFENGVFNGKHSTLTQEGETRELGTLKLERPSHSSGS